MDDNTITADKVPATCNYWDDAPVNITAEANFIWSIANKLRGSYMPDKYGDVIIPMTIIRRFECALEPTKNDVVGMFARNPNYPVKGFYRITGYPFYNTSGLDLKKLTGDADSIRDQFKEYIAGFSANVQDILNELEMIKHVDKMDKDGCLFSVVTAFSELDLSPETFDSIRMGYIFENLIARFYENVDAGQFYTGRDIIKMMVSVLLAEGCDDLSDKGKVITIGDQACGTGGMLTTAHDAIKRFNLSADVRLFGQEFMGPSYAVGLAEMLIKNQSSDNFRHADTFKEDCFPDVKMRLILMNPPFGTPWAGKDAKAGQEDAVKDEFTKGKASRWPAGLPGGGDGQLLFMQSAISKMDEKLGRAAIIENGSPLFTGGAGSGESNIRMWMLQQDLVEAIIAMPTDLFYNTGIQTYVWILSKNKRSERRGKIQLIDASGIFHKLRKPLGNKKNEFSPEDREAIVKLYVGFDKADPELSRVFDNEYFMYREYTVMQPMQRSYGITPERIERMLSSGTLSSLYDAAKIAELEAELKLDTKSERKLKTLRDGKPVYEAIIAALEAAVSDKVYLSPAAFEPVLKAALSGVDIDKKLLPKIMAGMSVMDKTAEIQKDRKGNIIYDKETKDKETVTWTEPVDDYMAREVLPYVPDAVVQGECVEGAEIGFTRIFYKYKPVEPFDDIMKRIEARQASLHDRLEKFSLEVG